MVKNLEILRTASFKNIVPTFAPINNQHSVNGKKVCFDEENTQVTYGKDDCVGKCAGMGFEKGKGKMIRLWPLYKR